MHIELFVNNIQCLSIFKPLLASSPERLSIRPSVNMLAVLESSDMLRTDGKRLDGMTLVPWCMGHALVFNITCVNTLAPSHVPDNSNMAGCVTELAERSKSSIYLFTPFRIKTLGPWGPNNFPFSKFYLTKINRQSKIEKLRVRFQKPEAWQLPCPKY